MQVEGQHRCRQLYWVATGGWVSNAYLTYPIHGDSPAKVGLIPDMVQCRHLTWIKDLSV